MSVGANVNKEASMGLLGYSSAVHLRVLYKRDEKEGSAVIYAALSIPASLYGYADEESWTRDLSAAMLSSALFALSLWETLLGPGKVSSCPWVQRGIGSTV